MAFGCMVNKNMTDIVYSDLSHIPNKVIEAELGIKNAGNLKVGISKKHQPKLQKLVAEYKCKSAVVEPEIKASVDAVKEDGVSADDYCTLPYEMLSVKRWLVWKSVPNDDPTKKPRKVPHYASGIPRNGELDTPKDMANLSPFDDALLALQTGEYTGLGFALGADGTGNYWQGIDLDEMSKHPELAYVADDLPGYTEQTPSGDGWHAIGYGRPFNPLGSNKTGIEAYSSGRFFTITGELSGINSPCCLADFVGQRLKPIHSKSSSTSSLNDNADPEQVEKVSAQTVRDLRSALLFMRADDRELWQRNGHRLKTLGEVGRGLFMEWSATSEAFDPLADAKTWESFKPTHTGYKAVFKEAQEMGWTNPGSNNQKNSQNSSTGGFNLLDWDVSTRYAGTPPKRTWLVDDALPMGKASLLAASGGVGKSFLLLGLAHGVAKYEKQSLPSFSAFGKISRGGVAVMVCAEDDAIEVHNRLAGFGELPEQGRLIVVPLPDVGMRSLFDISATTKSPETTDVFSELRNQLKSIKDLSLVVIDPLQALCGGLDLNLPQHGQFVCGALNQLAADTGAAVCFSHHLRKGGEIKTPEEAREAIRGSGGLVDGVRCALVVWPDNRAESKAACKKLSLNWERNRVCCLAVVKANFKADTTVKTLIRDDNGLLINRSYDLYAVTPKYSDVVDRLIDEIEAAAVEGNPFTKTGVNGIYERQHDLSEHFQDWGRDKLRDTVKILLSNKQLECFVVERLGKNRTWLGRPKGTLLNQLSASHVS